MAEVLTSTPPHGDGIHGPHGSLLGRSPSQTSLLLGSSSYPTSRSPSPPVTEDTVPSLPRNSSFPSHSEPPKPSNSSSHRVPEHSPSHRNLALGSNPTNDDADEDICFPSYGDTTYTKSNEDNADITSSSNDTSTSTAPTPDSASTPPTEDSEAGTPYCPVPDDMDAKIEPSSQVDYFSHDWREEDIWSTWKHVKSNRSQYGESHRLENACWRTWTKRKDGLKTMSPEKIDWLKDCDVTWLYGPLQQASTNCHSRSEPASRSLSKNSSFLNKKPILKKRSVSEVMLQKSLSSSSLLKQAAAAVQAQRKGGPGANTGTSGRRIRRAMSDVGDPPANPVSTADNSTLPSSSSSGLQSPDSGLRRHIRFDNRVEQCIAVDFKESTGDEREKSWTVTSDSEEENMPTLKAPSRKNSSASTSSRSSFSQESKGIAMLPATTLKFHNDPDCQGHPSSQFTPSYGRIGGNLSASSSQETLRPPKENTNFMINEDDEEDVDWQPSGAFSNLRKDSLAPVRSNELNLVGDPSHEDQERAAAGLRRTPSGMFMPYDEDSDDEHYNTGFLGRIVDTVNTARDIATVVWWNVGWGNRE